jgi:hypothetical protein
MINIKKEKVKNSILIILGLIIGILGVFVQRVWIYYYYYYYFYMMLSFDLRILFLLIGAILCLYGTVNYLLVKRGDLYEKLRHPIEDFTVVVMSPIIVFLITSLLNSNFFFVSISQGLAIIGLLFGILIGFIVAGPALYYLYLSLFRREEYQKIIKKKEMRLRFSEPFELFRRIPMIKIYTRFSRYYKQVFGICVLVGILIINLNFLLYSLATYLSIFFVWTRPEFLFILAGIITLRTRKVGFLIFQFAVILLLIWVITSPMLPFAAFFLV